EPRHERAKGAQSDVRRELRADPALPVGEPCECEMGGSKGGKVSFPPLSSALEHPGLALEVDGEAGVLVATGAWIEDLDLAVLDAVGVGRAVHLDLAAEAEGQRDVGAPDCVH